MGLLAVHVAGAGYLGLVLIQTIVALLKNDTGAYAPYSRWIAIMLVLQTVSGCLLTLASHQPISALAFCGRFSLYVIPALAIEILLFLKMLPNPLEKFPLPFVARAFCASVFLAIGTLVVPL